MEKTKRIETAFMTIKFNPEIEDFIQQGEGKRFSKGKRKLAEQR